MMTYKIIEVTQFEETIFTLVEYNFDGTIIVVNIPHFMPNNNDEIELGITNRALSEKRKLDAISINNSLVNNIIIGEEKPIN